VSTSCNHSTGIQVATACCLQCGCGSARCRLCTPCSSQLGGRTGSVEAAHVCALGLRFWRALGGHWCWDQTCCLLIVAVGALDYLASAGSSYRYCGWPCFACDKTKGGLISLLFVVYVSNACPVLLACIWAVVLQYQLKACRSCMSVVALQGWHNACVASLASGHAGAADVSCPTRSILRSCDAHHANRCAQPHGPWMTGGAVPVSTCALHTAKWP
jgi:hypothetical protein